MLEFWNFPPEILGNWESNSGPLEEKQVLLTTDHLSILPYLFLINNPLDPISAVHIHIGDAIHWGIYHHQKSTHPNDE